MPRSRDQGGLTAVAQALTPGPHQPVLPQFDTLVISSYRDPFPDLTVLTHVLGPDGGAPNLRHLVVGFKPRPSFQAIGAIFAAGGLARLLLLELWPELGSDIVGGMTVMLDGAVASPHRLNKLRAIRITFNPYFFDTEARMAEAEAHMTTWRVQLAAAQAQRIFSNAVLVNGLSLLEEYV